MARITVEDCLSTEDNRFVLVRLAANRAKQLLSGKQPVVNTRGNKEIVSALREVADGKVRFQPLENHEEEGISAADIFRSMGN
ncbi:MAG: DNA-directed RNA polymerase subunit omega [bacterium]|nr:DNA-directed RNA polymerase subunit omega [bacterium]